MNFVSNRNIVIRSVKTGMAIKFVKGEPTYVPPKMHNEVMEKGILPVEETGEITSVEKATSLAKENEPKIVLAPEDGDERAAKILEVITALVQRNNPNDFTAAGMPNAKSITAALGWKVDTKEVRRVWEEHRRELLNGSEE